MDEFISEKISQMSKLVNVYLGVYEQDVIFDEILHDLRKYYISNKKAFSVKDINYINKLKQKKALGNEIVGIYNKSLIDTTQKYKLNTHGLLVMHKTEFYLGLVDLDVRALWRNKWILRSDNKLERVKHKELISIGMYKGYKDIFDEFLMHSQKKVETKDCESQQIREVDQQIKEVDKQIREVDKQDSLGKSENIIRSFWINHDGTVEAYKYKE